MVLKVRIGSTFGEKHAGCDWERVWGADDGLFLTWVGITQVGSLFHTSLYACYILQ